ncbi:methyl-accepting chemotaxis protein [Isoptericola sp. b490]|uniref:methyl-accepting chemotaxis protein n=1 Tax=Actinotalea lenta TaxID=3064654 RepID=UPI0027127180|nr:methyl-accepting chemotaxis protein [Isoptericola sp. b490]MDO8121949.1 methyl-accepting chemotaxis protein [Isoptericola sp. b490]
MRRQPGREIPSDGVVLTHRRLRTLAGTNDDLELAAADLTDAVDRVGRSTGETASAAERAAGATARVEGETAAVAGAAAQISAAMREVADSAARATGVTAEAAEVTGDVRASVERLTASTSEIDSVVRTVSGISDQTRMLALNATIEAARAGAAGRGFAVVAEEVKNLAALTSEATIRIADQLAALATDSAGVRAAAERIDGVLSRVDALQQTIAAAVEEQTAAIAEITRAASEAAGAAGELDGAVTTTARAAAAAASAVERSRAWLERVGRVLDQQREIVAGLDTELEVHPLRAAISAHGGWKRALRAAIETGRPPAGIDRARAARSDACAFGQWLGRGDGAALDPARSARATALHADFHRQAAQVLEAALSGATEHARDLFCDDEGYSGTAIALTDLLVGWLGEAEAAEG